MAKDAKGRGKDAAATLAQGSPKSAPGAVHPAMGRGPFPSNADFVAKYGGPRNHAAEQRGFNSGMLDTHNGLCHIRGIGR